MFQMYKNEEFAVYVIQRRKTRTRYQIRNQVSHQVTLAINIKDNYHKITPNNCEDEPTSEDIYFHRGSKGMQYIARCNTKLKIGNKIAQIESNAKIDTGAMSNL